MQSVTAFYLRLHKFFNDKITLQRETRILLENIRLYFIHYPLSNGVPVRERYGFTLLPATREQHDQNCTHSH